MRMTMSDGTSPGRFFDSLLRDGVMTEGDVVAAVAWHRSEILDRTARGVDYEGRPFARYENTRPYYWKPGKTQAGSRPARNRMFQKLFPRGQSGNAIFRVGADLAATRRAGAAYSMGRARKSGTASIFFSSYAAFKAALGRTHVDLTGPRPPHMLQQVVIMLGSIELLRTDPSPRAMASPADAVDVRLGIFGEAADRAEGHNEGTANLPRRRFLDVSESDWDGIDRIIITRIEIRLGIRFA